MVLYKYVGFDAGLKILETNTLGFSLPRDFNDPFEVTALGLKGDALGVGLYSQAVRSRFLNKYAILSLTRAPLNPLMWSHYADSHKGIVIGVDTEKAGLESFENYTIPAQRGEMIYVNTVPKSINSMDAEQFMRIGDKQQLSWASHERLLKHAFLYKQLCWAYEEEVRIVKCLGDEKYHSYNAIDDEDFELDGEQWKRKHIDLRNIFLKNIPPDSIVEIYLGQNSYSTQRRLCNDPVDGCRTLKIEYLKGLCEARKIKISNVSVNQSTWNLEGKVID